MLSNLMLHLSMAAFTGPANRIAKVSMIASAVKIVPIMSVSTRELTSDRAKDWKPVPNVKTAIPVRECQI